MIKQTDLDFPENWLAIDTIDMHTGGEPLRVIVSGFPPIIGNTILECRRYVHQNFDYIRTALMWEPRGHADMYGCILLPPQSVDGDFGILFMHNEGYSTMCGHAIIAISTLAAHMQWITTYEGDNPIKIDSPCGRILSWVQIKNEKIERVKFHCVPSFVVGLDMEIDIPGLGNIVYDLAYGGAYYAYVDIEKNNLNISLQQEEYADIIEKGKIIKAAIMQSDVEILHPYEPDLGFLYGIIFTGKPNHPCNHMRNVCVFADGELDRSPTGSGVSGRIAIERARGNIDHNHKLKIESITDAVFTGSLVQDVLYGSYKAVIPQVEGTAYITGKHTFLIDPNDPMKNGFLFR